MKRFIFIISLLITLLLAFSLASCGDGEAPPSTPSSTASSNGGSNQPPKGTRTTITEQEWNKIVSLEGVNSFTLMYDQVGYKGTVDNDRNRSTACYYSNGIYMQAYKTTHEVHTPGVSEPDYIVYDPYYEIINEEITSFAQMDIFYGDLFVDFFEYYLDKNLSFSSFTYNEETKSYDIEYSRKQDLPPSYVKLFFENGVFTKWTLSYEYESPEHSEKYDVTCLLYDWNETEIPYPRIVTGTYEGYMESLNKAQTAFAPTLGIDKSYDALQKLKSLFSTIEPNGYLYESVDEKDITLSVPTSTIEFGGTNVQYDRILITTDDSYSASGCFDIHLVDSSFNTCLYVVFGLSEDM